MGHRYVNAGDAHFKNIDDFNQDFSKTMWPVFIRYCASNSLTLQKDARIEAVFRLRQTCEYPLDKWASGASGRRRVTHHRNFCPPWQREHLRWKIAHPYEACGFFDHEVVLQAPR